MGSRVTQQRQNKMEGEKEKKEERKGKIKSHSAARAAAAQRPDRADVPGYPKGSSDFCYSLTFRVHLRADGQLNEVVMLAHAPAPSLPF